METIKAAVECDGQEHFIKIMLEAGETRISMSEDNSKEVKRAFNKIIARIKEGLFQIEIDEVGEDLFSQVGKEYISQLNREIREVHALLKTPLEFWLAVR